MVHPSPRAAGSHKIARGAAVIFAYNMNDTVLNCGLLFIPCVAMTIAILLARTLSKHGKLRFGLGATVVFVVLSSGGIAGVFWLYPNAAPWVYWLIFPTPVWMASGAMTIRLFREADCISIGDVFYGGVLGYAVSWLLALVVLALTFSASAAC
jgi:hypothetical protein